MFGTGTGQVGAKWEVMLRGQFQRMLTVLQKNSIAFPFIGVGCTGAL